MASYTLTADDVRRLTNGNDSLMSPYTSNDDGSYTLTTAQIQAIRDAMSAPTTTTPTEGTETESTTTSTTPIAWDDDMTLAQLRQQLIGSYTPYQAQDEATLRQRAESMYKPQYESDLSSLRSNLTSQLSQQNNSALSKGMQRSSWNSAAKAGIRNSELASEAQLGTTYAGNVSQQYQNLLDQEQNRVTQDQQYRDNLMLQLYSLQKNT